MLVPPVELPGPRWFTRLNCPGPRWSTRLNCPGPRWFTRLNCPTTASQPVRQGPPLVEAAGLRERERRDLRVELPPVLGHHPVRPPHRSVRRLQHCPAGVLELLAGPEHRLVPHNPVAFHFLAFAVTVCDDPVAAAHLGRHGPQAFDAAPISKASTTWPGPPPQAPEPPPDTAFPGGPA